MTAISPQVTEEMIEIIWPVSDFRGEGILLHYDDNNQTETIVVLFI